MKRPTMLNSDPNPSSESKRIIFVSWWYSEWFRLGKIAYFSGVSVRICESILRSSREATLHIILSNALLEISYCRRFNNVRLEIVREALAVVPAYYPILYQV